MPIPRQHQHDQDDAEQDGSYPMFFTSTVFSASRPGIESPIV